MKSASPYLTFNGDCGTAMKFYQTCLKGDLQMMPFSEMPAEALPKDAPKEVKERIMHARLTKGTLTLMASDTMPTHPFTKGNNFSISIDCENKSEVDQLTAAISEGGSVTMKPQDTFWGAYFSMAIDKFGIAWMFNYDRPQN